MLEGADYETTYGASASRDALSLQSVTEHEYGTNIGRGESFSHLGFISHRAHRIADGVLTRLAFYLMADDSTYDTFTLMDNEFAFAVELSTLEGRLNGALYLGLPKLNSI